MGLSLLNPKDAAFNGLSTHTPDLHFAVLHLSLRAYLLAVLQISQLLRRRELGSENDIDYPNRKQRAGRLVQHGNDDCGLES